jgi:hypothetical protein
MNQKKTYAEGLKRALEIIDNVATPSQRNSDFVTTLRSSIWNEIADANAESIPVPEMKPARSKYVEHYIG